MTSNAGTSIGSSNMGFYTADQGSVNANIDKALKEIFRPEFLNRIDDIIEFKELTKDELTKIIDLMLKDLVKELEHMDIKFVITDSAKDYIVDTAYDPIYGARPLKRFIGSAVETLVARKMIAENRAPDSGVTVTVKDGRLAAV